MNKNVRWNLSGQKGLHAFDTSGISGSITNIVRSANKHFLNFADIVVVHSIEVKESADKVEHPNVVHFLSEEFSQWIWSAAWT